MEFQEVGNYSEKINSLAREKHIDSLDWGEKGIPEQAINFLKESDVHKAIIPYELGGEGSVLKWFSALKEISYFSSAVANIMTTQSLLIYSILLNEVNEKRKEILFELANVESIGCFALTEPKVGSNAKSIETTAQEEGSNYIINGEKRFIINAEIADVLLIAAQAKSSSGDPKGITLFLVPKDSPGIQEMRREKTMGLNELPVNSFKMKNVKVDRSMILGEVGNGWTTLMDVFKRTRPGVGAVGIGIAQKAIESAIDYSKERIQFGREIRKFQTIGNMISEMIVSFKGAESVVFQLGKKIDEHNNKDFEELNAEAAIAKIIASDMSVKVVDQALQIYGGAGYLKASRLEKLYRDARVTRIYDGTNEVLHNIISNDYIRSELRL